MRDATLVLALVACAVAAFLCLYVILAPGPGLPALTRRIVRSARTFARAGPRNRSAPRDRKVALAQQMPVIKELLTDLGVKIIECEGYEADDILGTLSKACADSGNECFILTGDRDSFQLVSDSVTVRLAGNKETKVYTPQRIMDEYGVSPRQMIEVKALMGDTSDNIKGVKGIGEKTALDLIQRTGSVDGLYEQLPELKLTPSVRAKLEGGHQDALDSRFLAEIFLEVPIDTDIESYRLTGGDREKTRELLAGLEMFKLMERLDVQGAAADSGEVEAEKKVTLADLPKITEKALESADIKAFEQAGKVGCELKGGTLKVICGDVVYTTDDKALVLEFLRSDCTKYALEGKSLHLFAFGGGARVNGLAFCCDLAGYLLNSQSSDYTVENLCLAYKVAYRSDCGENADIASLLPLCENLEKQLADTEMTQLYRDIELPLCEVLASMEYTGVKADADGIRAFGESLKGKIAELKEQIFAYAGEEFNIASTKQLGVILFEKLGLPVGKKTKTKTGYSTGAEVLEELENKHPIIPLILEYRTLTKLDSTYVEGLLKQIGQDGRVHSVFKQTETRTGRISSTEPNMQNIPVRKEIGRNMRKFFVAKDGYVLVDADYSQIELRVLSCVCGDENMQEAFLSGRDIHRSTAAQVFDLPEDFVSDEMRRAAKAVNFGIIYGIGPFSLSKDIGVSVAEAKQYISNYLANYPKVSQFMDKTVEDGIRNGYVTTIFGRRRYIPELNASNKNVQAFGRRAAMNAPIQGAAADIIKLAMVKVYARIAREDIDAHLILQVHDELILEVAEKDRERAEKLLKEEMEGAVRLAVPFTADVHSGHSWYDAKG